MPYQISVKIEKVMEGKTKFIKCLTKRVISKNDSKFLNNCQNFQKLDRSENLPLSIFPFHKYPVMSFTINRQIN